MKESVQKIWLNHYDSSSSLTRSLIIGGSCVGGFFIIFRVCQACRTKFSDWQERRDLTTKRMLKVEERNLKFEYLEKTNPLTTPSNLSIIDLDFNDLQKQLQTGHLKARSVLEAFVAKAVRVTREFNCVTEFVPQMWELADKLDSLPPQSARGPLHGLPICVKEDTDILGMDTTLGYSRDLFKPAKMNSVIVQILMDHGAVPFCKTNLPQTVFSVASTNPIFGETVNHLNNKLSPGGSSSGTACLVGAGGASFGTGTDLGGSLRCPAHMSGLCTLRPTILRMSRKGVVQSVRGAPGVAGVPGILSRRAETVAEIFKILTANAIQNRYDPIIPPIGWREELFESTKPLKIGYFTSLPLYPPLGDTPAVVLEAKTFLEKMGHTLIPFEVPADELNLMKIFASLQLADGGNGIRAKLRNDHVTSPGQKFFKSAAAQNGLQSMILNFSKILHKIFTIFAINKRAQDRSFVADEKAERSEVLWQYLKEQEEVKYKILEAMETHQLELVLSPVFPFPAPRLEDAERLLNAHVYTALWSLVDFPSGVVPFGQESGQNISDYDDQGDAYLKLANEGMKHSHGMPIGVQVTGKPYFEEVVLRVMVQLDKFKNLSKK